MKDIHEIKDNQLLSFNHVGCRGVAARAESVYSMDRKLDWKEGPEHIHNSTILLLKEAHSPRNFDRLPGAHRKYTNNAAQPGQHQNDVDDIPPHPHDNHTTHFLHGWSRSTYRINNLSNTPTSPWSSTSLTDILNYCLVYHSQVCLNNKLDTCDRVLLHNMYPFLVLPHLQ